MNVMRATLITILVTGASLVALLIPLNISTNSEQPRRTTGATISLVDSLPSVKTNFPSVPETVKAEVAKPPAPTPAPAEEEALPTSDDGIVPRDVDIEPETRVELEPLNPPIPEVATGQDNTIQKGPVTETVAEPSSLDVAVNSDDSSSDVSSESSIASVAVSSVSPVPLPSLVDGYYEATSTDQGPSFDRTVLASRITYPPLAKRQGIEGLVVLRLYISSSGKIERIEVEEDPGYGLAEAAVRAFTGLQGKPAILEGKAVAVMLRYPVRFTLK